ncbi:MAG: 23S rRNA pseudouridine(1911/1915/1917) synthase RluD [Betaproteobacteria bacterium]|nr:23S rRNA pseudouridine(1911/1915/1917) synthase RluD [Betaproteobacteria bacterium]
MATNYKTEDPASLELTVPGELAGLRLDQALARLLPQHSRSRISGWMRLGEVHVSGAVAKPKQKVWGGEHVRVAATPAPEALAHRPEPLALAIAHEDDALIVIDKPAGLVVHPGSGNWSGTLLNALLHHCPALAQVPRAGIVHRLDKDTSGLMVVAKTLAAQTGLVRQIQRRSVGRIYQAIAHGDIVAPGSVDAPIGRHRVQRTRMAVVAGGRDARTHYAPLERFGHATLVECVLDTGRTHQIRVHLAAIDHPLLGDPVYGRRRESPAERIAAIGRQALHAVRLELEHPVNGQRMRFRSALPPDLEGALERLRAAHAQ